MQTPATPATPATPTRVAMTDLPGLAGTTFGPSSWRTVRQEEVDRFADLTGDHNPVHTDPTFAAASPFGGTIAHGLLTLSLLVHLCLDFVPKLEGTKLLLNYGFDKVRFVSPVRVGSRIRASASLSGASERGPGEVLVKLDVVVEIEGEDKPALVAEWLSLHVVA